MNSLRHLAVALAFGIAAMSAAQVGAEEKKVPESIPGTTLVSAEDAVNLITSKPDLVVVDARLARDRDASGWIEGSVPLPNTETTPESLAKHVPNKNTPVLFYCNGVKCGRSVESVGVALQAGYKNIYWFRGGWEEWTQKGLPATRK
jgi:rhodanese-related sulfurtransferase